MRGQPIAGALRLVLAVLLCMEIGSSTLEAESEPVPLPGQGPTRAQIEDLSRRTFEHLYSKYVEVLTASGYDIQIEIGDIRVVMKEEFDRVHVRDVVTLIPAWRLESSRSAVSVDGQLVGCTYVTTRVETRQEEIAPGFEEWNPTVQEALRLEAEMDEAARERDLVALASAAVHLRWDDQTIQYRAELTWNENGETPPTRFGFNDRVAWEVLQTSGESSPIMTKAQLERKQLEVLEQRRRKIQEEMQGSPPASCFNESKDYSYPLAVATDEAGHASGNHQSRARLQFTCGCDSACTSTASGDWETRSCLDAGQIWGIASHSVRQSEMKIFGSVVAALDHGAQTKATAACFVQSCLPWSGCGGGDISFNAGPLQITASFSGPAIWDGQLGFNGECGKCTERQPLWAPPGGGRRGPFHIDPDPYGGGGGSGYYASDCLFQCWPYFSNNPAICGGSAPCWIETCDVTC